jgi:hypothetical protein
MQVYLEQLISLLVRVHINLISLKIFGLDYFSFIGVYLTLSGQVYSNNSVITKAEITETANGLQCVTDKMPCCQTGSRVGEWHFPNGSVIPEQGSHTTFFVSRGDSGTVNLNYVDNSSISSTSGQFCCEVPDANGLSQTQCALLSELKIF